MSFEPVDFTNSSADLLNNKNHFTKKNNKQKDFTIETEEKPVIDLFVEKVDSIKRKMKRKIRRNLDLINNFQEELKWNVQPYSENPSYSLLAEQPGYLASQLF